MSRFLVVAVVGVFSIPFMLAVVVLVVVPLLCAWGLGVLTRWDWLEETADEYLQRILDF